MKRGKTMFAVVALCAATAMAVMGQTFTTMYSFCTQSTQSWCADGANPFAGLVQGTDGNLYGTTAFGGACVEASGGCGTVFRITPAGELETIVTFAGANANPYGALAVATNGDYYGTTYSGGSANSLGTVTNITDVGGAASGQTRYYRVRVLLP